MQQTHWRIARVLNQLPRFSISVQSCLINHPCGPDTSWTNRAYSSSPSTSQSQQDSPYVEPRPAPANPELARRKRKAEWKRRQGGQSFLDHTVISIQAGRGGDGCVAFNREKFKPYGPPSGGNGGRGGSVYIRAVEGITSLSGVPKHIHAHQGLKGQGTWQNGRRVPDVFIDVPVGTVVREIRHTREAESEERDLAQLSEEERIARERDRTWVHYPSYREANEGTEMFLQAEQAVAREKAARRREETRRLEEAPPLVMDLDHVTSPGEEILIASGGKGGVGNQFFLSSTNRSPKFATRGYDGDRVTIELELKILADIGLVGFPNAGKSTLLRALTNAKAQVASYAFTTLNPQVGIVRVWDDGTFDDGDGGIVEDDVRSPTEITTTTPASTSSTRTELLRFTIADNPGLIAGASDNIGLGHSFLRSIERSHALVYVVDFSKPEPWDDLEILRMELEAYKVGLSQQARMVVANKADLLGSNEVEASAARAKLQRLRDHAEYMSLRGAGASGIELEVVAISGKYRQNLTRVVSLLGTFVMEARGTRWNDDEEERDVNW